MPAEVENILVEVSPATQVHDTYDFVEPSWSRNRGNHCETCADWSKDKYCEYVGLCCSPVSIDFGEKTDSRYRCPAFRRKNGI